MNTQDDFWRMVWQEKVTDIVILTNTMEGAKVSFNAGEHKQVKLVHT